MAAGSGGNPVIVRRDVGDIAKSAHATIAFGATNLSAAIWTPVTGKKFRILGFQITTLVGAPIAGAGTAAKPVRLVDNTVATPIACVAAVPGAVSTIGAYLADTGFVPFYYTSTTVNNVLYFHWDGSGSTSGLLVFSGTVFGIEV